MCLKKSLGDSPTFESQWFRVYSVALEKLGAIEDVLNLNTYDKNRLDKLFKLLQKGY